MESKRYSLNKEDFIKIAKVLGYSAASAVVGSLIVIVKEVNFPVGWTFVPAIINILLVALKKFITNSQGQVGASFEE